MTTSSLPTAADEVFERFDKLYEFDRQPVTPDRFEPGRHFAAVFAGEHVAGTEFIIGATFVAWGVSARDLLLGLLLGNLFAVLSWTLVCAPIAVETRLTLYWYLRKIAGPTVTTIYNVLNALMFCILSGTMITVSASSVRLAFGIPAQLEWYPQDPRFVLLVIGLGAVVVVVAIAGFRRLAQFNEVCVPWIFTMFFAGAVATLPALAASRGGASHWSLQELWRLANETIWVKKPGGPMGFWHVVAFAWVCNLAMHVGLSDMALLRFAKRPAYGLYSACGMYLGHYLAWACAGAMGAAVAAMSGVALAKLDAGDVAYQALGFSGAIAVVLAGWSTSNPTLYRAGLALQAITPGWPRWVVTLLAGVFTTAVACFPFVFTKLLEFVGLYGILLMPIGAIVFVEHYVFPRIGLTRYWFAATGSAVNWPALVTWFGAVALVCGLHFGNILNLFFVPLPIWFLTAIVYTALATAAGARSAVLSAPAAIVPPNYPHVDVDSKSEPASTANSWIVTAVGFVALVALVACFAFPIWVFVGDPAGFTERLANYRSWLTWATFIHLTACAIWIVKKNK